jgi:hypothetical protein
MNPVMATEEPSKRPSGEDLKLLHRALRRNRRQRLGAGLGAGIVGLSLVFAGVGVGGSDSALSGDAGVSSWTLLAAGLAIWGIGFAGLEWIRSRSGQEQLLDCLQKQPERIVWVYYYKVESMPYGIRVGSWTSLQFRLDDKEKFSLRCREEECQRIMNALRPRLSHASFGHSVTKAQWYEADPELLRR